VRERGAEVIELVRPRGLTTNIALEVARNLREWGDGDVSNGNWGWRNLELRGANGCAERIKEERVATLKDCCEGLLSFGSKGEERLTRGIEGTRRVRSNRPLEGGREIAPAPGETKSHRPKPFLQRSYKGTRRDRKPLLRFILPTSSSPGRRRREGDLICSLWGAIPQDCSISKK